jgi:basic membrane protein A
MMVQLLPSQRARHQTGIGKAAVPWRFIRPRSAQWSWYPDLDKPHRTGLNKSRFPLPNLFQRGRMFSFRGSHPDRRRFLAVAAAAGTVAILPARGAEAEAALVYDYGGKWDKSFNQAAYEGALRFKQETGIGFRDFEITNESQREQTLRTMARRGAALVIGVGFGHAVAIEKVARLYPDERFVLIDARVDLPNVQSVIYREEEGCFLVGMLAALASKTGTIGFVGGMDAPVTRKYLGAFTQGARAVKPDLAVLQTMVGTTAEAWTDPARGAELARSQLDRGADVLFAAAGASGLGVMQAAADAGKLSIGTDSNQNPLHPGSVLTSMIKRVDLAVYQALMTVRDGSWAGGTHSLGLKEQAIGWVIDGNNRALITPDMKAQVDRAAADILAGKIVPVDVAAP